MKKIIALIVAVLFVFAVASASVAAEPAKMVIEVIGEVTAVNKAAKTITVKGMKGDVVITVDDKTLAGVKAGDEVTAQYTHEGSKNTAKAVKIAPGY